MSPMPKACVIGWPVAHSRSPVIHRYWLEKYGIAGHYESCAVLPDDLPDFLGSLGAKGHAGGNITLPHKEMALSLMDTLDETARRAGAVNTVAVKDGKLCGSNTDIYGFVENLKNSGAAWKRKGTALVIGAGGAARAAVAGLAGEGSRKIYVTNRTPDRLRRFMAGLAHLNAPLEPLGWPDREDVLPEVDLVVNTTSQGMDGQPPLALDLKKLKSTALVNDMVYAPLVTPLLAEARARNLATVDGLGMLLHQAAPGFALWFGRRPEVDQGLRRAVEEDLKSEK